MDSAAIYGALRVSTRCAKQEVEESTLRLLALLV